jgi:YesN/AraC family two-component response regulator
MVRAVICDDETASLTIIQYLIKSENLPIDIVGTASNGLSALELIRSEKPELAFLDIQMPRFNGFEVVEQLRGMKIKIIIITVYSTFAYAQKALRLGVSDIIEKPIHVSQLKDAINRAIGWNFTDSDPLNLALHYIYLHYSEAINLNSLAEISCCSPSHLAHLFKQHFDMSALSYIHKIRISKASQILQDGFTVQEAAAQTGYNSLNHFYKYFKLYQGITPGAYRHINKLH